MNKCKCGGTIKKIRPDYYRCKSCHRKYVVVDQGKLKEVAV